MTKGNERLYSVMRVVWLSTLALVLTDDGCGNPSSPGISLTLSSGTALLLQDGTPASVNVTISRSAGNTKSVTLTATGLPSGLQLQFVQPGTGATGTVTVSGGGNMPAGTYSVTIRADDGGSTASQPLSVIVGIVAAVGNTVDVNSGVSGKLQQFISTSFGVGDFSFPVNADLSALNALEPQHIRIQVIGYVPMSTNTGQASDWDFTTLDGMVQPLLAVADNSPSFEIAVAPDFLNAPSSNNATGKQFVFNAANLKLFAQYCANLVRYYNTGGFDWGGQHFQSPSSHPITWWAIFNEYNINGLTPSQYVQLYNTVVPAMQAVDPTIKFIALELSTFNTQYCTSHNLPFNCASGNPQNNLPTFVAPASSDGVSAQVDAVSIHLYSSCDWKDTDAQVFSTVPLMVELGVSYIYHELQTRPDLANVPLLVTESNINSDYNRGDGMSICTGLPYVEDPRGTSAFFAGWRAYVFSQIGKAGSHALFHWDYADSNTGIQTAMVDTSFSNKYLSYWVEYWLAHKFPWDGATPGPDILTLNATETSTIEMLAARNSDGSVVVMIADHAVGSPTDDNGPGAPRTVVVDLSALGQFTSGTQLTIDANSDTTNGPATVSITPASRMTLNLGGYGVTFVTLRP